MQRKKWVTVLAVVVAVLLVGGVGYLALGRENAGESDKKAAETQDKKENKAEPASFEEYQVDQTMLGEAKDKDYDKYFLPFDLQTVSIEIDDEELKSLFADAVDKPSVMTKSVTIGDETMYYAGLKTKGNYTLEHTAQDMRGSRRFSFTVNFGKYVKKKTHGVKQNFHGVQKISFNNFFFDKTQMKEFFALKLMDEMGVPTPRYGLSKLYINGRYYGVYAMIEAMDSSILERYYGVTEDELSTYLTKPENTTLYYDEVLDSLLQKDGSFHLDKCLIQDEDGNYKVKGDLDAANYLWEEDEETLQDVADMLPSALSWLRKLNLLNEGKDFSGKKLDVNSSKYVKLLDSIMDVDEVLRYFAAHSFLVQLDNMFTTYQNYGLYIDQTERATLVAWDYDLSFGCYFPSDAESTANYDIDIMYKSMEAQRGVDVSIESKKNHYKNYPLFGVIFQNSSLRKQYHQYMKDCTKIVALGGETTDNKAYAAGNFNRFIDRFSPLLWDAGSEALGKGIYYLNDTQQPHDLKNGLPNLAKIMAMRAVGVRLQLDGEESRVSGADCDLSTLGNAIPSWGVSSGRLAAVSESTGIYTIADYDGNSIPMLTAEEVSEEDDVYQDIKEVVALDDSRDILAFRIECSKAVNNEYTIHIPCMSDLTGMEIQMYTYQDGKVKQVECSIRENIISATIPSVNYIVLAGNFTTTFDEVKSQ